MIKNVVFDLGQVLFRFEPKHLVEKYVATEEDKELLANVLFSRELWDRLDAGTIEDSAVVDIAKSRLPERLHGACAMAYQNWIYNMPQIPGMREVVSRVKKMGKKVLLLSNISKYFASHASEFDILSEFEFCFFSAEHGLTKPSREIYERLCEITQIVPEETIFIDDSQKNLDGASMIGIKTYLFDGDAKRLFDFVCTL